MKITLKLLQNLNACGGGIEFVTENKLIGLEDKPFIEKLISLKRLDYANWLTVRILNNIDKVRYAVFAAEQVIDIFEKKYTEDDRPRKAILAAKNYIENPCDENKDAAYAAACAATYAAAYAAGAAANAAGAAAYAAADAAANAAAYAAANTAAYAAAYAAANAADAAANAADAGAALLIKIIRYGIELIKEVEK